MAGLVPKVDSLDHVYAGASESRAVPVELEQRFKNLIQTFKSDYGHKPDFVSRSPGRVNIIGEHVDYSLYNVLPAALTVDVLIAIRIVPRGNGDAAEIKIANINPTKYPSKNLTIPNSGTVKVDRENHSWSNYFLAGLKGSLEYLQQQFGDSFKPNGMEVLIDGNVPAGGGLSSSAAFVCASALGVMAANNHDISKQDLLDLCIVSERAVGVFSGGMDQAASIFSERGYLLYCRFFPEFSAEHVPMPTSDPEVTFLIAQSFVTSDKAVTAPLHYNLRVVECTLATVVLAKLHDIALNPDHSSLGFCLRNFQEELMKKEGRTDEPLAAQVDSMIEIIKSKLKEEGYTRQDIAEILGISVQELEKQYMSKFPIRADLFKLRQRALHVLEEAGRVLKFRDTLTTSGKLDEGKLLYLGDLMNKTQASCRDVYECSCPEIDQICSIAHKAGAYGTRLTGAGWGGCTVHLVPQHKILAVTEALKQEYYYKKFPEISKEKLEEAIVVSKPNQGSSLIVGAALDI
ncbi:galactokinase [Cladophialophora psammophila CBS 110553]|uniref:Galactokinase n=1 Tax=Cladophialophora psammophila CBS 110553 TaxID=1182543 RepID=W9WT22_9EURO|nr:galactokinase [Cladophialophora psammophila CBS 110553]EXJ67806.1 galactokinase [Cladophialophora psammophila CBS 110553]